MKTRFPHPSPFVAAALVLLMAGCDGLHAPIVGDAVNDAPEFDLANPTEVVQAWAAVFSDKDNAAYEALLADEFEFYPKDVDASQFPWMIGNSWNRTVELGIVNNMFDPNFSGEQPPVDRISLMANLQSQSTNGQGRPEITFQLVGQILTGPADGFGFDTRMKVELVSVNGKFEIYKITELDAFLGVTPLHEANSFGRIKAVYRT